MLHWMTQQTGIVIMHLGGWSFPYVALSSKLWKVITGVCNDHKSAIHSSYLHSFFNAFF